MAAGALTAFFAGCVIFSQTSAERAETARFDDLADAVEHDARIHLLENRETELIRQVARLESRRDEILAELAAVHGGAGPSVPGSPTPPNLVVAPRRRLDPPTATGARPPLPAPVVAFS